jgi:ABC-type transport system substrate-binding protein
MLFLVAAQNHAADKPKYGGKIVIGQDIDATGLNPYKRINFAATNYFDLFYDTLLDFDLKGKLIPNLAVSWEYPDSKTLIVRLRKGVKWHDGKDFGAKDVKANFDYILDPKNASFRAKDFKLLDRNHLRPS